ncbi:outer membrane beta-barrel protein [Hymenobacter persicinus]|uniref:PorT family protein n=1 Tax=Hymenobacter persicinus TaxID=2025506 RepID=A0A4Q5LH67_9BACT|nr:outer membrane beta-barrel protein [Hymenobacter persicinus]RYU83293.1 PorT family protein [Hymenobacter persicinus]
MKRLSSLLAAVLLTVLAAPCRTQAANRPLNDDTIMVKLPNQATMTLITKNKAQLKELRTYHLDSLMILLDSYISQADAASKNAGNKAVTMEFYPAKDKPGTNAPEEVRITVRAEDTKSTKTTTKVGRFISVTVDDDDDNKGKDGKKDEVNITFGKGGSDSLRTAENKRKKEERANRAVKNDFSVDLGLNALTNVSTPAGQLSPELKPIGSRYISLNWHYDIRLGAKGSPLYLRTGPELAFNNYMLDNNTRFDNSTGTTRIVSSTDRSLEKSKLAVTTINLPLMAMLNFQNKKGHDAFRLGAGGYVGYRVGSHTKIKYNEGGRDHKDKDKGGYNLEDFQYGLQGTIGVRGIDLFVKYGMSDLFKNNRGPQAQTLSFGFSI